MGKRPEASPCCSGRSTSLLGGARCRREVRRGKGRAAFSRERCIFWGWLKIKKGSLSHVHVSFQTEFKVIPLAQIEKILFPTHPDIPAEDVLVSQKWLGKREEGERQGQSTCATGEVDRERGSEITSSWKPLQHLSYPLVCLLEHFPHPLSRIHWPEGRARLRTQSFNPPGLTGSSHT